MKEIYVMWKGFLIESKTYMSYKDRKLLEKIKFWISYPTAYIKFKYYEIKNRRT